MWRFILILSVCFVVSGLAIAQDDDSDECYFEFEDGDYLELGDSYFSECAELLIEVGYEYELYEAYGYWGDFYVYVGETGDVYYYDDDSEEWLSWGTVDVPYDEDSEDSVDDESSSSGDMSLDEIFDLAIEDINTFWEEEFEEADYDYDEPDVYIVDSGDVETDCGPIGESTGPAYCGSDNTIYIDIAFMEDSYDRIGDFAPVIILAHEWGHSVEEQLGYFNGDYYTITTELMADCFAGAYTNYLMNESEIAVLDEGDIEEAMTSLFENGDDLPWFDEDAHGTGEERVNAFNVGMEFGTDQCFEIE